MSSFVDPLDDAMNTSGAAIIYCRDVNSVTRYYERISYGYVAPVLIILGLIGNIFNYVIFSEISRHNLGMYYMKTISLLDIVVCLLFLEHPLLQLAIRFNWPMAREYGHVWFRIKFHFTLLNSVMKTSSLLLLLVCLERYFFIYRIRLHQRWCRSRWAKLCPWLCFLVSLVITAPQVIIYPVTYCQGRYSKVYRYDYLVEIKNPKAFMAYQILKELILTLIPLAIIFWLNFKLFHAFRTYYYFKGSVSRNNTLDNRYLNGSVNVKDVKSGSPLSMSHLNMPIALPDDQSAVRADTHSTETANHHLSPMPPHTNKTGSNQVVSSPIKSPTSARESNSGDPTARPGPTPSILSDGGLSGQLKLKGRAMLVLLFYFVAFYALFILPISFLIILYTFLYNSCPAEPCVYRILIYVFNTLELCNYCLNFYLYISVDGKFREIFWDLLCCEAWSETSINM